MGSEFRSSETHSIDGAAELLGCSDYRRVVVRERRMESLYAHPIAASPGFSLLGLRKHVIRLLPHRRHARTVSAEHEARLEPVRMRSDLAPCFMKRLSGGRNRILDRAAPCHRDWRL